METTYFNEPDVQVTSSVVVAPWGVYRTQDIRKVEYRREFGVPIWAVRGMTVLLLFSLMACLLYFTNQHPFGLSSDVLLIPFGVWFALYVFLIRPRYRYTVLMQGVFGLVTFDCGDNQIYAIKLTSALKRLLKENQRIKKADQEQLDG
jgi:hypothetical protein